MRLMGYLTPMTLSHWLETETPVTLIHDNQYHQGHLGKDDDGDWQFIGSKVLPDNTRLLIPLPNLQSTYRTRFTWMAQ